MANYGSDPGAGPPPQQPMQPEPQQPDQVPPGSGYTPPGQVPPGGYVPPQGPGGYVPPQGMPPQGMPTQYMGGPPPAPPRRRSPCLIIAIVVLVVVLVCGVGSIIAFGGAISGVINGLQSVTNAGNAYMTALRDGDYTTAYNLSAPALQQEAGNAQGIQTALSSKQPASWSFTSSNINNDQGTLSGTASYKDGTNGTVDLVLVKVGNDWKVAGISMK